MKITPPNLETPSETIANLASTLEATLQWTSPLVSSRLKVELRSSLETAKKELQQDELGERGGNLGIRRLSRLACYDSIVDRSRTYHAQ